MKQIILKSLLCGLLALAPSTVVAKPLLDCPMRDAAFSMRSPLIDLFLNDAAKGVIDKHLPGARANMPPIFASTKAPSFASILTLEKLAGLFGGKNVDLAKIDAELDAIALTRADKIARCERYDDERPRFALPSGKPRLLLFEKMTGFRDTPSVEAANAAFKAMAARNGWALVVTDKGGAINAATLKQFDAVIWNNISGDVLTLTQRKAFRRYIEGGGGYVGVHGSAGDPVYFWDWYPDTLVGARFIGHPSDPQFQDASVRIEGNASGIGEGLAPGWAMKDEWYSFARSARLNGGRVIATLDETTYKPGTNRFGGPSLAMGDDHPIAWTRCVGKGRSFYSAIGHRPETYSDARHVKLLEQAIAWAAAGAAKPCQ